MQQLLANDEQRADRRAEPRVLDVLVVDEERAFAESLAMALTSRSFGTWHVSSLTTTELLRSPGGPPLSRAVVLGGRTTAQRQALRVLTAQQPDIAVVVLLMTGDEVRELPALVRAGARGWTCRTDTLEHLNHVLREVSAGGWWLPRWAVGDALLALRRSADERVAASFASLTPRERQVLAGLVEGLPRSTIARQHRMSVNTVRTHVQHLFEKLGVHSSLEAVVLAQGRDIHAEGRDLHAEGREPEAQMKNAAP